MSKIARAEFDSARTERESRNDARRIRTRVEEAKQGSASSSVRWPFELVQNAHDAGPRDGSNRVEIYFSLQAGNLVVSHTGKPFTADELAALLSGGSSKEFDDSETTGRFGTGFLVTHALSTRVDIESVMDTKVGCEFFRIELARDGDEDAIIENIKQSGEWIGNAEPVSKSWIDNNPTAKFIYRSVSDDVAHRGLYRLQQSLPYLYATCEKLGRVCISNSDRIMVFEPGTTAEQEIDGFVFRETGVSISDSGEAETRQLIAMSVGEKHGNSTVTVVLENCTNQKRLKLPDEEFPKLFVQFPISQTSFLPFNIVLNGQFTPKQERDGILMDDHSKDLISTALSALPTLVQYAAEAGWIDAHKLAQLDFLDRAFGGENDSDELKWWQGTMLEIAKEIAAKPIIKTESGLLPALHGQDSDAVSFLVPAINSNSDDDIDYNTIHDLAAAVTALHIPGKDVAQDWGQIARQWASMGVPVKRLGFEELADLVKEGRETVNALPLDGNPFSWLANFFLQGGKLGKEYTMEGIVNGLVPDQHSKLRRIKDLYIDGGVSEEIKDIADSIGIDVRSVLLHNDMAKALQFPGYESANEFIFELLKGRHTESDVIDEVLDKLGSSLPHNYDFKEGTSLAVLRASARLVAYLAEKEDIQRIRRCPLLTSAGTVVHLTGLQILAPVIHWPQSTQPYADLYTQNRVLSDYYCEHDELIGALAPLIAVGLVIKAPLYEAVRPELDDANLLNAMVAYSEDASGVTVRNETFTQIAFLSAELVNRSGNDPKIAQLLMGFVLDVAARDDQSWHEVRQVNANRSGVPVQLSLPSALWPFELKVRSWIPVPLSEELTGSGYAPGPANEANLQSLYEPSLLRDNPSAIRLLNEVFGFKELTLMLARLEPEVEANVVQLLRDPALVQTAAENPEAVKLVAEAGPEGIQEIREQLDEQKRQAEITKHNRSFGFAAQEALAEAIESYNLDVKLVDRGYDYEVTPLDEVWISFGIGSYFLEVKATTTGDVRLTPLQAQTASEYPERFILCVIDLRGQEIPEAWEPCNVEPFAKIVTGVGADVSEVYSGVDSYTGAENQVRLRNEQQLRYGISTSLWENGVSIREWIESLGAD